MHLSFLSQKCKLRKNRVSTLALVNGRVPSMTPEKLIFYKERIHTLYQEIKEDLEKVKEDLEKVKDGEKVVELDTSIGRLSRMDAMQSQQMALELRRRKEQHLMRLDSALIRIQKGTFGACGRCKKPIKEERLKIQPDAVLCIQCAG